MDTILSIVVISISVLIVTVLRTMWYQEGSLNFVRASLFLLWLCYIRTAKTVHNNYTIIIILVATTLPIYTGSDHQYEC